MTSRTKRFALVFAVLVGIAAVIGVAARQLIAISMAPKKRPTPSRSAEDPADARKLGFLGGAMVAEGTVDQNEKLIRRGYYTLRDAIEAWPEFNLFTAGFVMSRTPSGSSQFREAVEWQWRTLDLCAEARIDRKNPDYSKAMALETRQGVKRACWNSWIAPHNFEGFFLNMGDMGGLVTTATT